MLANEAQVWPDRQKDAIRELFNRMSIIFEYVCIIVTVLLGIWTKGLTIEEWDYPQSGSGVLSNIDLLFFSFGVVVMQMTEMCRGCRC